MEGSGSVLSAGTVEDEEDVFEELRAGGAGSGG